MLKQCFGNRLGGGADVEDEGAVVWHAPGHRLRDAGLAIGAEAFALLVRNVFSGRAGHPHTAVKAGEQSSVSQSLHVAPHSLQGDPQVFRQLFNRG